MLAAKAEEFVQHEMEDKGAMVHKKCLKTHMKKTFRTVKTLGTLTRGLENKKPTTISMQSIASHRTDSPELRTSHFNSNSSKRSSIMKPGGSYNQRPGSKHGSKHVKIKAPGKFVEVAAHKIKHSDIARQPFHVVTGEDGETTVQYEIQQATELSDEESLTSSSSSSSTESIEKLSSSDSKASTVGRQQPEEVIEKINAKRENDRKLAINMPVMFVAFFEFNVTEY